MKVLIAVLTASTVFAQGWQLQTSGTKESLRGISAVNKNIAWASGTKGTILKTTDGGKTWLPTAMANATDVDFRDIEAINAQTVYAMSAGPGALSRVYKTINGGSSWTLQATNPDPKGFWDCMSFWSSNHGIVVGDPIDGRFDILTTEDGGAHWKKRPGPEAQKGEGMFAASGTCVFTQGARNVWFATGGLGSARVFHSIDGGANWTIANAPIRQDAASSGIFSIAFADRNHAVTVGGNYSKPGEAGETLAISNDGGKSWTTASGLTGFRSAISFVKKRRLWIATGTSGTDISTDGGKKWKNIGQGFNALSFASDGAGWAVGAGGSIAIFNSNGIGLIK